MPELIVVQPAGLIARFLTLTNAFQEFAVFIRRSRCFAIFFSAGLLAVAAPSHLFAADPVDFVRDVKPILKQRCFACHGALQQKSGLRLDSGALVLKGGDGGPVVVAGNLDESLILERVTAKENRMPPEGAPLTEAQIALLKSWIEQGAKFPDTDRPEADPRDHWAFRVPARPALPPVPDASWVRSPIDAFIAAQHQRLGLKPSPPADKATLLRRVTLDLVGLPPTREELQEFLADDRPDAYERVVDRLLDSPQYGERWARHWMDVWRYSDWYGRRVVPDVMNSYPMLWRWRDWIVRSLNDDRGYDWMVERMLAADEIDPASDADVVATGFVVRNWFKWNYNNWMRDQVEHTGKAFLGLTFNCAHCHDHKYDPITQADYFRMRAFFEPLELRHDRVAGEADPGPFQKYVYAKSYGPIKSGLVRIFDEKLDAQTFMYEKGDERKRMEGREPVAPGVPVSLGGTLKVEPVQLPPTSFYPGLKPFIYEPELATAKQAVTTAEASVAAPKQAWESQQTALTAAVTAAEAQLATSLSEAAERVKKMPPADVRRRPLGGTQSLLLDAATGRRTLGHKLAGLTGLETGSSISLLVQIVQDAHFNFQLGLDVDKGLTGGYVAFEKGHIQTYAAGGKFQVIDAGIYDVSKQNRFRVTFRKEAAGYKLHVVCLNDDKVLADNVPCEVHGWLPVADGVRGIFIDARPGTVAMIDEIAFTKPDGSAALKFDFEPPASVEGQEVGGSPGWIVNAVSRPPATSLFVSAVSSDPAVREAMDRLHAANVQRDLVRLPDVAAQAKLVAARAAVSSIEARVAADQARYSSDAAVQSTSAGLIAAAAQAEQQARLSQAHSSLASAELGMARAEVPVPPIGDAAKDQQQAQQTKATRELAQKQLANAQQELAAATAVKEPSDYTPFSPKYPPTSTGRRRALARWITSRENPLAARVAVNHLWGWHFGRPLVESTFNFGRGGKPPSHPEMLDWLAVELRDSGWKMKRLHRLIVISSAYQMRSISAGGDANLALDQDNRFLWRFNPARVEAEIVRDSVLAVSGELDRTIGGPELDQTEGLTSRRRSLYFAHHGEEKMKFLELFDAPSPADCYQRTSSVTPQQALALSNSDLTVTLGKSLAAKLWEQISREVAEEPVREPAFLRAAFEQILTRPPTPAELDLSHKFLKKQQVLLTSAAVPGTKVDPSVRARESFIQALLNHNDFVTVR